MPVLNRHFLPFEEPVWNLADKVSCRTIPDIDYGAVWRYLDDKEDVQYRPWFDPKTKCIYFHQSPVSGELNKIADYAREQAILVQALFNLFSDKDPIVMSFAVIIDVVEEDEQSDNALPLNVAAIIDLEPVANIQHFKRYQFKLKPTATQERLNQFYRVVCDVAKKFPEVYVTLSRFNTALTRTAESDRLIDITISLESLIREKNELNFKFATYLSFIIGKTPQERLDTFQLLHGLYSARSGIVHGTPEGKDSRKGLRQVSENWDRIIWSAKAALIYYVFYLYSEITDEVKGSWKDHLKRLMLGNDSRLFD
ncbi:MAG: hypothetical protein ABSB94_18515 [Syntrophorhabdales bacterium]|jgi:hypothetical protein